MKFPDNNIIDNWLETNQDAGTDRFIEKNLAITEKICDILKERKIKKKQFAKMLGKSPSEVSKWLSGLHNLTLKSITKIEAVLDIDLINIDPEIKYVHLGVISSGIKEDLDNYEKTNYSEAS